MLQKPDDQPASRLLQLMFPKWQKISALKTSFADLP
jgi:hypothetical protein